MQLISMQTTHTLDVRALDCRVHFEGSCPEVRDFLARYVFSLLPESHDTCTSQAISIRVDHVDGGYRLAVDDIEVARPINQRELVLAVMQALDESVIYRLKGSKAVHAGAVAFGDRALLIPGITHAGKSSMVAELLRRGATLLSDEYALIDMAGFVHAYPRSVVLRDSCRVQSPMLPEELGSSFATEPVPVRWILALEYKPESVWEVREVPQSEALMTLLTNTPHPITESPEMIDFFVRAVSGARCYAGFRGEVGQAADRIVQLVGKPA